MNAAHCDYALDRSEVAFQGYGQKLVYSAPAEKFSITPNC